MRSALIHLVKVLFASVLATAISGCGDGDGEGSPPPAASASIGAAGGSLVGPDGVRLDVPAGALSAATTITITRDASGAPARSQGESPVYAITPHGLQFAQPATLTLPPQALAKTVAGAESEQIDLLRAQPGGAWEALPTEHDADGSERVLLAGLSYYTSFGRGFGTRLEWVEPRPGTQVQGNLEQRRITQDTRVRVRMSAFINSRCGGSFEGGVELHSQDWWRLTLLQSQVQSFNVNSPASVSHEFEFDIPASADKKSYQLISVGRCLNPIPPQPNTQYGDGPPVQRQLYIDAQGIAAPTITRQPVGGVANPGDAVQISIEATAPDALVINWQRSDDGGATWVDIDSHAGQLAAVLGSGQTSTRFRAQVCNRSALGSTCILSTVATVATAAALLVPWQPDGLIAGSGVHSMAIDSAGVLWTWGSDNGGALGRSSPLNTPQPVTLPGATRTVAAGGWYSVALLGNGDLYAWGWGANVGAAIGSASNDNPLPAKVAGLQNVRAISSRYSHTLALDDSGAVWGFGPETNLQLGPLLGHQRVRQIAGLADIRQIAAGELHSLALASDGTVWSWGSNNLGQLGAPATPAAGRADPQRVQGLVGVIAIDASSYGSFALVADGTAWSWGAAGSLGRDSNVNSALSPSPIPGIIGAARLGGGHHGAWAVLNDGSVLGWGGNGNGQTGIGTAGAVVTQPTPVPGLSGALQVAGAEFHSLALVANGGVLTWGGNGSLALAGTPGADRTTPAPSGFTR